LILKFLTQQTICRKLTKIFLATIKISHAYYIKCYALIVIKLVNINSLFNVNNPQITNALLYKNKKYIAKSLTSVCKRLSMLVGISEAIRLLSTKGERLIRLENVEAKNNLIKKTSVTSEDKFNQ